MLQGRLAEGASSVQDHDREAAGSLGDGWLGLFASAAASGMLKAAMLDDDLTQASGLVDASVERGMETPAVGTLPLLVRTLLSVALAGGLLFLLSWSGFALLPTWSVLGDLKLGPALASELCIVAAFVVRAMRMKLLMPPGSHVTLREVCAVEWWSHAANFVLPFRLGEFVRPSLYATRGRMSFAAALSSTFADRVIEGLVLLVVLALAIPLGSPIQPLPTSIGPLPISTVLVPVFAYMVIGAYVAVFAALLLMMRAPSWMAKPLAWLEGLGRRRAAQQASTEEGASRRGLGAGLAGKLMRLSEQLAAGLAFLRSPRMVLLYLAQIVLYWIASVASLVFMAWALGIDELGFVRGWAVLGTIALGMVLPGAPGYLGSYQAAAYAGLALYLSADVVLGPGAELVAIAYVLSWIHMVAFAALAAWIAPASGTKASLWRPDGGSEADGAAPTADVTRE